MLKDDTGNASWQRTSNWTPCAAERSSVTERSQDALSMVVPEKLQSRRKTLRPSTTAAETGALASMGRQAARAAALSA